MFKDKQKYTVREAVVESFKLHKDIYEQAKKGACFRGMSSKTVTGWYEDNGSRVFLIELAKKKIEDLTLKEINEVLHWSFKIINCSNPCRTCGQVLKLDDEFWFIPFSYCDEYPCGIQICSNCVMELAFGLKWKSDKSQILFVKDAIRELKTHDECLLISESVKLLRDYNDWVRDIEYDCKEKREAGTFVSVPSTLPHCKLTKKFCSYDTCPKRLNIVKIVKELEKV